MTTSTEAITVKATVHAPVEKVWKIWTEPKHIIHWNNASEDWHTPRAENDIRVGGKLNWRMEAKDESFGFDFSGAYTKVEPNILLEYRLDDGRMVSVFFKAEGDTTIVTETFDAEETNSKELQQTGWQAILDSFKNYAETNDSMETINFSCSIHAPVEKAYQVMLNEETYREWTAAFNPTSHFIGSWNKGDKILFIGTDNDGVKGGMVSRIEENIPNKFVSIKHLGLVEGDEEITTGPKVEGWAGAFENYTFIQDGDSTRLEIEMDANEEFKSYFEETWPKALNILKSICEG